MEFSPEFVYDSLPRIEDKPISEPVRQNVDSPGRKQYRDISEEELQEFRQQLTSQSVNPMMLKKRLARDIVTQFHDAEAATGAAEEFTRVFQNRGVPEATPEIPWKPRLDEMLVSSGTAKSISEAKRLISQGAVEIDGSKMTSLSTETIKEDGLLKVGKRGFFRVVNVEKSA